MMKKRSTTSAKFNTPARPQRLMLKLQYFQRYQLVSEGGSMVKQTFNLNSIYDPDSTGYGGQPLGRDEWAPFYNKYRVYKVTYQMTLTNTDQSQPVDIAILNCNGFVPTLDNSVYEQPNSRIVSLGPASGAGSSKSIYGKIDLARLNGKTHLQYRADEETAATLGNDPVEILTQNIIGSPTIVGSPVDFTYSVKYTYYLEFFDPKVLPIS